MILGISGSLRAGSSNLQLLQAVQELAPFQLVLCEGLGELPHFNPDLDAEGLLPPPAVAALRAQISACEGVIISSPEYAHGLPGSLKNLLDWLVSYPDFAGKKVLLLNASAAGGQHAQASLREILRTMSAQVLEASLVEPFVPRKGQLDDAAREKLRTALRAFG